MIHKPRVIIYKPAKTAMQSGKARTKCWVVECEQEEKARFVEPLMGWTGSSDMTQEVRMPRFASKEEAIGYAERNGYNFRVIDPELPKLHLKAYADNFTRPIEGSD